MIRHCLLLLTLIIAHRGSAQELRAKWNIMAVLPDGRSLPVKAFGPGGETWSVQAIEDGNTQVLHVRAVGPNGVLPVKVIASDDAFLPVKAIGTDGALWEVKAVTPEGTRLDVKGVARWGHVIHIKALGPQREIYGVKAISSTGRFRDVKGVKVLEDEVEAIVNGVKVAAHVKALPQAVASDEDPIWNVKAIGHDGVFLPVKAIDKSGAVHDVKAFMENGDRWIMDVKAIINGKKVPIKMLVSTDALIPVKAIGKDGTIYDVKALTAEGGKLDVKGVQVAGNIIHLKAIATDGTQLGVKAISAHGAQYDVKGIKFTEEEKEAEVSGVPARAHVKAIPPVE